MRVRSLCLSAFVLTALIAPAALADDWPQWLGPKRDSVWRETGILDKFPTDGPKALWRADVGYGYAGPAVAGGRVYVTDYVTKGKVAGNPTARARLEGKERVLCLNAKDGKLVWEHAYDCPYNVSYPFGPRCTPMVHEGKVYTLGAMGNLLCLDAATGDVLWSHDYKKDYGAKVPIWGFAGHPLVVGDKVICLVGGEGSVAVAFDRNTGKEIWKALSAREPGYSSPALIEAGGTRQLIIWHAEAINGLDPDTGKVYWSVPLAPSFGMSIATPRKLGEHLFASGMGNKAALLDLAADRPKVKVAWDGQKDKGVYCSNSTPFLEDGMIYGVDCMGGQLRGVKVGDGDRVWESLAPTTGGKRLAHGTAFIVKNGDRFFLLSETGELIIARLTPRAYEEISRCKLLEPTSDAFGRKVLWSHPAFAGKCVFARNDKELICASLAAEEK